MGGEYMVEIEDLKDKVSYIEREKIANIEKDIVQIKMSQVETNTLVKEFTKTMNSQSRAMESISQTMQEMALNMRDNNNSIKELKENFNCFENETNKNMFTLQEKISIQEKSFKNFMKDNWGKLLTLAVVFGVVVYEVLGVII